MVVWDFWTINSVFVEFLLISSLIKKNYQPVPSGPLFLLHPSLAGDDHRGSSRILKDSENRIFPPQVIHPKKMHPHGSMMRWSFKFEKKTCVQISLKKNHMFFEQPFNSISRSHYSNCIKIIQHQNKKRVNKRVCVDTPNSLYHEKFIQPWASGGARGSCLAETSVLWYWSTMFNNLCKFDGMSFMTHWKLSARIYII